MPKLNNTSQLNKSLAKLLTTLQRKKTTFSGMYSIGSINDGIKALESIQSIPIDSLQYDDIQCDDLQYVKQLINIEQLFKNSSTLKVYPFPKFREVINPAALIYAEIDLQLDELEKKAKVLLDHGHLLESSKTIKMVFSLRTLNRVYFLKGKIDYPTYRARSLTIINQERPELESYFGYQQIFGNLLILIDDLGTEPLLNTVCTGNFLFFEQPDNGTKQIDTLNETISSVEKKTTL